MLRIYVICITDIHTNAMHIKLSHTHIQVMEHTHTLTVAESVSTNSKCTNQTQIQQYLNEHNIKECNFCSRHEETESSGILIKINTFDYTDRTKFLWNFMFIVLIAFVLLCLLDFFSLQSQNDQLINGQPKWFCHHWWLFCIWVQVFISINVDSKISNHYRLKPNWRLLKLKSS